MLSFQKLSLLLTLLFLIGKPATGKNHCADKCGHVRIEFPFYLINKNLNHSTDYPPEFGLLCNQQNVPILELPDVPLQLFVRKIHYEYTLIETYDPQNCLPNQLLKLGNASIFPLRFPKYYTDKLNFSFFRCDSLPCPIFLLQSDNGVDDPQLVSCTKLKDVSTEWWGSSWFDAFAATGQGIVLCDSFQVLYPEWIHNLLEGKDVQISLEDEGDAKIAKKLAIVGLWCIQWNPADRPSMKTVVQMLEGDGCELVAPPSPFHISGSSTTNTVLPARPQNLELEVIHEIEENNIDQF
ncbi:LEAF RUST 10 DISEASE-RESISTANCE LOCUS RECEPTOR-LIKE PROTEIN KINASE-like 2.5 [Vigna angularis]|uniref:RING-type E3 ubiquitin transferase n=1 Tax=Phaseolus angularis TaxID=3914 RepID=A0A8T0JXP8_PHAAN|nr:LEAF RUST 10 DISEASE-RESISTANCE LOCUS RECEPTOR-LIKE PROTEIN KINASE-like 2.5 [Vigna angularis]